MRHGIGRLFSRGMAVCFGCAVAMAIFAAFGASEAHAGDAAIRAIVYNVQFLPGPGRIANKRPKPEYRARRLGEEMSKFDIVCLNEAFDDVPRENILAEMKKAWGGDFHVAVHPRPPQTETDKRFNGGLLIASRFPILESHHIYYTHFSLPKDYGFLADGFAAKGVLHARVLRRKDAAPDEYIDVFTTHLEARADNIRPEQYPELSAFVREHSDPAHPAIITGDMNTHGMPKDRGNPESQYNMMMTAYAAGRPAGDLIDVWPALKGDAWGGTTNQETTEKGSRIDYVMVSNPKATGPKLKPLAIRVNGFLDPQIEALSDHSAVEVDFEWQAGR